MASHISISYENPRKSSFLLYVNIYFETITKINKSAMYLMVLGLFKFFARCQYFMNTWLSVSWNYSKADKVEKASHVFNSSRRQPSFSDAAKKIVDDSLRRDEVESVMERLGLFCHPEGELLQERMGFSDISNIFEEKEPSLDEVKGAFDVFDDNRDGFIDAKELHRVLCALGLKKRLEMEDCRRMIRLNDENGDGKIDFDEFAKFMEMSFC